jgi:hypothetical protein
MTVPPPSPSVSELQEALLRGIAFLESRQCEDGEIPVDIYWPGYSRRDPSVFPTALAALALSCEPRAQPIVQRALDFLEQQQERGGLWRHRRRGHVQYHQLPPDLDDTACASVALRLGGRAAPDNVRHFLANRDRRGRFRTWRLTLGQLRRPLTTALFFLRTDASPFDVDPVVNANVLFYLGRRPETEAALEYVLQILRSNAEASSDKWYDRAPVVRYFFSRALRAIAPEAGEMLVARTLAGTPTDALEAALDACTLIEWDRTPDLAPLLRWQLPNGGWPRSPLYTSRPSLPDGSFAPRGPMLPIWGSEELTTVFCVEALSRRLRSGSSAADGAAATV